MSLQSRCNYSVVAARVLWEGEEGGRGKDVEGGGRWWSNGEGGGAGRDEMCMQKEKRGGVRRGEGKGCLC